MKNELKRIFFLLLVSLVINTSDAAIVINEFMASNSSEETDPEYNETSDWIEIYNSGNLPVQLKGYYITDNFSDQYKWEIKENIELGADKYLIIWADGKNEGLHTNFKISADGEELAIVSPTGEFLDSLKFGAQSPNISMGRISNINGQKVFFTNPTPGEKNSTSYFVDIIRSVPAFSVMGGIIRTPFSLNIKSKFGGEVKFTLDGSEPTENSPSFSNPVQISKNTVVRARIIKPNMISGPIVSNTYLFDTDEEINDLPVISITANPKDLWDEEVGIYVQDFKPEWEIPINIEMFENDGSDRAAFNLKAGMKINGLYSWQLPQKMLGIYFRKKYGEGKLDYPLIFNKSRKSYKTFALRASGSDWSNSMFRDAMVQNSTMENTDLDNSGFRACVVYFNGQYMGIHNIREKIDEDFIIGNHGVEKGTFDMVENENYAEAGSLDAYNKFKVLYLKDLAQKANWDSVLSYINIINFTDLICTEVYDGNTSISHNIMAWKPKQGGLWKWIIMDLDRGFFNVGDHLIKYYVNQDEWPFYKLMENDYYRHYFGKRLADHLFTTFNPVRINKLIDFHVKTIEKEMPNHIKRWEGTSSSYGNPIPSMNYWYDEIESMKYFAGKRPEVLLENLTSYGFNKPLSLEVITVPSNGGKLTLNGLKVPVSDCKGQYPSDEEIVMMAEPNNGYVFKGWVKAEKVNIIKSEDNWKYNDSGKYPGNDWMNTDFNDSAWKTGNAEFGYGENDENTVIGYGGDSRNKYATAYFRKNFNYNKSSNIKDIKAAVKYDDGVVIYLNGREISRINIPEGVIDNETFALSSISSEEENIFKEIIIDESILKDGVNTLAVEVHQVNASSSDLSFDFYIQGNQEGGDSFVSEDDNYTFVINEGMQLSAVFEKEGYCEIPSEIKDKVTLSKDCSPYVTTGDVIVSKGGKLIVEPGVEIFVQEGASFYLRGSIDAKGTKSDPVVFKSNPKNAEGRWGVISFTNAEDTSFFHNAVIQNASFGKHPVREIAAISAFNSVIVIDSITITDVEGNPILGRYSDITLTNSNLHSKITGDIINVKYGKGKVDNCDFTGNDQPDSDAIDYDDVKNGIIANSRIHDFTGYNSDGIDIGEGAENIQIEKVLIHDITDKAISIGQESTVTISNSVILKCNLGVGVKDSSNSYINHCTFYGNNIPVSAFEKIPGHAGGNVNIYNTILSNSYESSFYKDKYSTMAINYSNSDNDSLIFGGGNKYSDPLFVNPVNNDFSLLPGSYCINSASDGNIGAEYEISFLKPDIIISDIAYLTDADKENLEFIGIYNPGIEPVNISGYHFEEGITFTFPDGIIINPNEKVYVTSNTASPFWEGRGANIYLWENGKLADEGEKVKIVTKAGIVVDQVRYNNKEPWPNVPDSYYAITLKSFNVDNHFGKNWTTDTKDKIVNVSIVEKISSLKIYPNPAEGFVNIKGFDAGDKNIELLDLAGKLILKEPIHGETTLLDLNGISSGFYLLKVGRQTQKLIVR